MKLLAITIGLLLTTNIYCFDTLSIEAGLQGIKSNNLGTTVYHYINLPAESGSYVLQINNLAGQAEKQNFTIETNDLDLIKIDWVKQAPIEKKKANLHLYERMHLLKKQLKELDHQENEELRFKNELLSRMVSQNDISSIRALYREKDIAFKKERMKIYRELQKIQSEIMVFKDHLIEPKHDSQGTLFLSIVHYNLDAKILKFNYFLAHPEAKMSAQKLQKDSQLVKGRVVESSSRVPLIFALVEIYRDGELIQSTHTDEMGVFETKLSTNHEYSFVIVQEGYKDRKVKKFNARSTQETLHKTYTLKEKKPMSFTEFASYALQVVSLISYNW